MPRKIGLWPEDHVAELKRLLAMENMSTSQLANAINDKFPEASYTRMAVIGKIHRAGLSNPRADIKTSSKTPRPRNNSPSTRFIPKKAPEPPSKPLPDISAPPNAKTNRPMVELEDNQCKWPVSETMACGAATPIRKPYCAFHSNQGTSGKAFGRPYMPRIGYK